MKDYDGGTHMECYVHPTVPYMHQAEMFRRQREFLINRIADVSTSTRVYPGLSESDFEELKNHIDIPGEDTLCKTNFTGNVKILVANSFPARPPWFLSRGIFRESSIGLPQTNGKCVKFVQVI